VSTVTVPARPRGAGPATGGEAGALSLEAVMVLPILALLALGLLEVVGVARDVLMLHEAARAGARAAATTTGVGPVESAVREAVPEVPLQVRVSPESRRDGDLVRVEVGLDRQVGPVTHRLRARAVARVEPTVRSVRGG